MTAKIKHFPGTALSESDFTAGKVLFNHDELHGRFRLGHRRQGLELTWQG